MERVINVDNHWIHNVEAYAVECQVNSVSRNFGGRAGVEKLKLQWSCAFKHISRVDFCRRESVVRIYCPVVSSALSGLQRTAEWALCFVVPIFNGVGDIVS